MKTLKTWLMLMLISITAYNAIAQSRTIEIQDEPFAVDDKASLTTREAEDPNTSYHLVGYRAGLGWAVNANQGNNYMLVTNVRNLGEGALRVLLRMKIDINNIGKNDRLLNVDLYDVTARTVIISRQIYRNDFHKANAFTNFPFYADLNNRGDHHLQLRVWSYTGSYVEIDKSMFIVDPKTINKAPQIINQSSAPIDHVRQLVRQAINGLGFNNHEGPNSNDVFYVGNYYMAWIDRTGFYGKMNGLWLLNNSPVYQLNFLPTQIENGRVFNFLAVAENGNGKWLDGYSGGAEHFELPHTVAENNDDNCAPYVSNPICNWYSVNEAGTIKLSNIQPWYAIAGSLNNKPSFSQVNLPFSEQRSSTEYSTSFLMPLTKEADNDNNRNGDYAHANFLFSNNMRYPVFLNLGYKFYANQPYLDRTYQLYNGKNNNASLNGSSYWSLIHGILISKTRDRINSKAAIYNYIRANEKGIYNNLYPSKQWVNLDLPGKTAASTDYVIGWAGSSFTLSAGANFARGQSLHHAHISPAAGAENKDLGLCFCVVHGALELGGGMLSGPSVNQLPPGQFSYQAIKRLGFPQNSDMDFFTNK